MDGVSKIASLLDIARSICLRTRQSPMRFIRGALTAIQRLNCGLLRTAFAVLALGVTPAFAAETSKSAHDALMSESHGDQGLGLGTTDPQARLQVMGGVIVGNDQAPCVAAKAGELIFETGILKLCDGMRWRDVSVKE
jgi:hypothetical protein